MLSSLDNKTLIDCLDKLVNRERGNQVEILQHMAELDRRRLYLQEGYDSLWTYCLKVLKFSESMAQRRIVVARMIDKYPQVISYLQDGRVTLCSLAVLAPSLTPETCDELLRQASGKTRREVEDLVGAKAVKPGARDMIRPLLPEVASGPATGVIDRGIAPAQVDAPVLSPAKVRVSFTARAALVDNLKRLQEILGSADMDETFYRATEALLDKVDPSRRHAKRDAKAEIKVRAENARPSPTATRHIPRALGDAVMVRDGFQCTHAVNGHRCPARKHLHIDHIMPFALGGRAELGNLRVLCAAHNMERARRTFGEFPKGPTISLGQGHRN